MRQAVGFANAVRKRRARDYYENFAMHARLAGAKTVPTFEEVYPDYDEEAFDVTTDKETVSIMDTLAEKQMQELEAQWRATNS